MIYHELRQIFIVIDATICDIPNLYKILIEASHQIEFNNKLEAEEKASIDNTEWQSYMPPIWHKLQQKIGKYQVISKELGIPLED